MRKHQTNFSRGSSYSIVLKTVKVIKEKTEKLPPPIGLWGDMETKVVMWYPGWVAEQRKRPLG